MAEDRASIDGSTMLDNVDERQVEFSAEVGGDRYAFAVRYAVLEALAGAPVDNGVNVVALAERFREALEKASARALSRGSGTGEPITVGEGDIL